LKVDFWHFFGFWLDKDTDNLSNTGMNKKTDGVGGLGPGPNEAKCPEKGYFFWRPELFGRAFFLGGFAPIEGKDFYGECPEAGQVF